ncbi:MAG: hypothetical protein K2K93_09935 [Muribaculaceae bacterium]|nr:hypothetical protein [Muribaculaceae bacterium]
MGRKKVYAPDPSPEIYEIPYDYWAFKRWCVNNQELSENSADVYISNIRTAFKTMFAEDDALFKNVRNAFFSHTREPERRIARLEDNYETLVAYAETVAEFGDDFELSKFNPMLKMEVSKPAPKEDWARAFQCYCRFIRWRIDGERMNMGLKIEVEDDHTKFLELPLRRQFRFYMQNKGNGYEPQTINTYCSLLKRLYNLLIRRVQKIDILGYVEEEIVRGESIKFFLDVIQKRIEDETKLESISDLSDDDVLRGEVAFRVYREFLEDYSRNPKKYPPKDCYEIPRRENKIKN